MADVDEARFMDADEDIVANIRDAPRKINSTKVKYAEKEKAAVEVIF